MEFLPSTEEYRFSTGRTFDANHGIVGLDNDLIVHEGYDGGVDLEEFTEAERLELADYMIALWNKFRDL